MGKKIAFIYKGGARAPTPVYQMTVEDDGTTILKGINNMPQIGNHQALLSKDEVQMLRNKAKEIQFHKLEQMYDQGATCMATTIIEMECEGNLKKVTFLSGEPKGLDELSEMFGELYKKKEWKKV